MDEILDEHSSEKFRSGYVLAFAELNVSIRGRSIHIQHWGLGFAVNINFHIEIYIA